MRVQKHRRFLALLERAKSQHELSDRELARQLGLPDNSYLTRWRREKGSPDFEVHENLATLLDLDMNAYTAELNGHLIPEAKYSDLKALTLTEIKDAHPEIVAQAIAYLKRTEPTLPTTATETYGDMQRLVNELEGIASQLKSLARDT